MDEADAWWRLEQRLAAHVPGATAHLKPDEGHISLALQIGRVLDDLASRLP